PPAPSPNLSPYTTLFRSRVVLLEQACVGVVHSTHGLVIEDHASDTAILREDTGLGLDLLRREHSLDRREQWVSVEELQVARQLRSEEHTSELQSRENLVC